MTMHTYPHALPVSASDVGLPSLGFEMWGDLGPALMASRSGRSGRGRTRLSSHDTRAEPPRGVCTRQSSAHHASQACFEPDAHKHSLGECWLKYQELPQSPEVSPRA